MFAALTSGKVQAADVFTTSPQIQTGHLVSLADPENNLAAENVIPFFCKKDMTPTIISALNAIAARLTMAALVEMNKETGIDHEDYSTVTKQWLTEEGLGRPPAWALRPPCFPAGRRAAEGRCPRMRQ